jgi:ABC-type antimicrobial peptide transport system permease subunit
MKLIKFYVVHSLRDMWRNRSRSAFALVCVATGVAAVVALRSLAFMVGDELTTNLAQLNRGDIRLFASRGVPELVELSAQGLPVFTAEAGDIIREWADDEDVDVTFARTTGIASLRRIHAGKAEKPVTVFTFYIEPEHYPFYDTVFLHDPAGVPLADAFPAATSQLDAMAGVALPKLGALGATFAAVPGEMMMPLYSAYLITHPRTVVISSDLARPSGLGLHLGDVVRIGSSDTIYIVRGIAPASAESVLTNPQTALFDYIYLPFGDLVTHGEPALADQVFIKVPLGRDIDAVEASLIKRLGDAFPGDTDFDKELNRASVPELERQNAQTADVIDDMILVMGLSSLLIGGIGIINTMLVVVSRRTVEIAVLKTLGLKGFRITILFLVEALLMGLIGSLIGVGIGVFLSYLIRDVGEEAFALSLHWRWYPAAMISGLFLGMIVTVLFGFLPTLIAGQVRPAIVLRPNEAQMPAAGLLQMLLALLFLIFVLGILVNGVVEDAVVVSPVYMITGAGALVGLFAGIIVGNTRLGQPIPDYYVFHLSRQFEELETWIAGAAGILVSWWPGRRWRAMMRSDRGRAAITLVLRGLRQGILLYGSVVIGIALASGILLILSEMWLPFGFGDLNPARDEVVKPANDVIAAIQRDDVVWLGGWLGLVCLIGASIRLLARTAVGVIALGSLGTTVGGAVGLASGSGLERILSGTGLWNALTDFSAGVVLVEGALSLLGAVFVGYWLLIWLVAKMPTTMVPGIVSLLVLSLAAGMVSAATWLGSPALIVIIVLSVVVWGAGRIQEKSHPLSDASEQLVQKHGAVHVFPLAVLGAGGLASVVLLQRLFGAQVRWIVLAGAAVTFVMLWRYLEGRFAVDGRLILREMVGRRSRVASTLLGLSVGIAGLSLVALTTGAVGHLLEVQLEENAEGNLLILDPGARQNETVRDVLQTSEGVDGFTEYTTYQAVLMAINSKPIERSRHGDIAEQDDPRENSSFERVEQGIPLFLSAREDLTALPAYEMKSGRNLRPEDAGEHLILLRESYFVEEMGIKDGDHLLLLFENGPAEQDDVLIRLTVVGIVARQSEQTGFGDQFLVPPGTLPDAVEPASAVTIAQIDDSDPMYMENVLIAMSDVPGVIALELSVLTQLVESLLEQLKAIPRLVAWLALLAGTAIIANTVALATQERRRQIGVMKAIGLKGWRVLGMLMAENGLIGLIAGLIGVGVGVLATVILVLASQNPDELGDSLDMGTMGWLVVLSISVSVGAAMLSAWTAAAEKPMDVLRYE